jgi:hypothetical protein
MLLPVSLDWVCLLRCWLCTSCRCLSSKYFVRFRESLVVGSQRMMLAVNVCLIRVMLCCWLCCRCLSSKYFFWDPEYAWLSLGRYGALREINWMQQAHAGTTR